MPYDASDLHRSIKAICIPLDQGKHVHDVVYRDPTMFESLP